MNKNKNYKPPQKLAVNSDGFLDENNSALHSERSEKSNARFEHLESNTSGETKKNDFSSLDDSLTLQPEETFNLDENLDQFDEVSNMSEHFSWQEIRKQKSVLQLFNQFANSTELA